MKYFLLLITFLSFIIHTNAATIYVNTNATGNNNGTSWANAFTDLQTALSVAIYNDQIWVATGIYKPTTGTSQTVSFVMKNGVDLYGGFAGTETSVNDRNIEANPTTLSGDIGQAGEELDNSEKIMRIQNITSNLVLDGFRIVNGHDEDSWNGEGAGIFMTNNTGGQITINNCVFFNNYAGRNGGAMHISDSYATFNNCDFLYNASYNYGGGAVYASNGSDSYLFFYDCSFIGNTSRGGAAILFSEFELTIDRCFFSNNTDTSGSIVSASYADVCNISNSIFVGNFVDDSDGAIISSGADVTNLINLTVCHNDPGSYTEAVTGGWYDSEFNIINCIIWGNEDSDEGLQVEPEHKTVINSIIEHGYAGGTNVLDTDPMFVNPGNLSMAPFDAGNYDYSLQENSPCVNMGSNIHVNGFSLDFLRNDRIQQGVVDVGAIESPYTDLIPPVANCKDAVLYLPAEGPGILLPEAIDNQSYDNTSIANYELSQDNFDCSHLGPNPVTLTVTDFSGNSSSCSAEVTVVDNLGPQIITPPSTPTVYIDANGNGSLTVNDVDNGTFDNCGMSNISISQTEFTCNTLGTTTITVTATDIYGNVSNQNVDIYVFDGIPPNIMAMDINVYLDNNGNASIEPEDVDAGSSDNCGIGLEMVEPNTFNCSNVGANSVNYAIVDLMGAYEQIQLTATVIDTISPLTIGQDITISLQNANPYVISPNDLDNGSTDNCGVLSQSLSMNTFSEVGVYDVELMTTDLNGNTSSGIYQVTVVNNGVGVLNLSDLNVEVFPNPFKDEIIINSHSFNWTELELINVLGEKILAENNYNEQTSLNTNHISQGIYFLRFKDKNGNTGCIKLIKN